MKRFNVESQWSQDVIIYDPF